MPFFAKIFDVKLSEKYPFFAVIYFLLLCLSRYVFQNISHYSLFHLTLLLSNYFAGAKAYYYTRRVKSHAASLKSKIDYIKALQKKFTFLLDPKIDDKITEFSEKLKVRGLFIYFGIK